MKFNELASLIARSEAKKREVSIGNIREILAFICEVIASDEATLRELKRIGRNRLSRRERS